jgi:hypothetical protein
MLVQWKHIAHTDHDTDSALQPCTLLEYAYLCQASSDLGGNKAFVWDGTNIPSGPKSPSSDRHQVV